MIMSEREQEIYIKLALPMCLLPVIGLASDYTKILSQRLFIHKMASRLYF